MLTLDLLGGLLKQTAAIIVHGASRQKRYATQKTFADDMARALNNLGEPEKWQVAEVPTFTQSDDSEIDIVFRVFDRGRTCQVDVIEAYWSPVLANRSNALRAFATAITIALRFFRTVSGVDADKPKNLYDGLICIGIVLLSLLTIIVATFVVGNLLSMEREQMKAPDIALQLFLVRVHLGFFRFLPIENSIVLTIQLVSIVLMCSLISGALDGELTARVTDRRLFILQAGFAFVLALLAGMWHLPDHNVLGVLSLKILAAAIIGVFIIRAGSRMYQFCSDLSIFLTDDANSKNFGIDKTLAEKTQKIILKTLSADPIGLKRPYDAVVIFGHSLGSVIALDALVSNSMNCFVDTAATSRVLGLVTYGTALGKVLSLRRLSRRWSYFAWQQYQSRVREIFSSSVSEPNKIYWQNVWTFLDPISNAFPYGEFLQSLDPRTTSSSTKKVNRPSDHTKSICDDKALNWGKLWVPLLNHGKYTKDDRFWREPLLSLLV